jgi:hypothetical protein
MRAQLIAFALGLGLAFPLTSAQAQGLSPEKARLVDRFAAAVRQAYALEREHGAAALAEIPPGKIAEMQTAVLRVKAMVGGTVDFTTLGRGRRAHLVDDEVFTAESPLEHDTQFLKQFYQLLEADMDRREDAESKAVRDAVQAFRNEQLQVAHVQALERLRAFEVKYGPGSPTLNVVEIVESSWLQRHWPFKPGRDGPSPWEVVSGYSTSYLTTVGGQGKVVSVVELGARHYNFSYDPDVKSGLRSYLTPRYWTAALAIGDGEDGALRMPFQREPRLGAALSWGDMKVAYLHGRDERWRLLVSRQFQLLPHLL